MNRTMAWVYGGRYASRSDHPAVMSATDLNYERGMALMSQTGKLVLLDPLSFPYEHFGQLTKQVPVVAAVVDLGTADELLGEHLLRHLTTVDRVVVSQNNPPWQARWGLDGDQMVLAQDVSDGRDLALATIGWLQERTFVDVPTPFGTMRGWRDDLVTGHLRDLGGHQRSDVAMLCDLIEPGDHVWDIGAHIGSVTVPVARKVGYEGKVLAVEGLAETCDLLSYNITRLDLDAVVDVVHGIVGPIGAALSVAVDNPRNTGAASARPLSGSQGSKALSLDQLWRRRGHEPVSVVKIDVEGMERDVLESGAQLLRKIQPVIWVEIARQEPSERQLSLVDLVEALSGTSYRIFVNDMERNRPDDLFRPVSIGSDELADRTEEALIDVALVPADHPIPTGWDQA